MYTAEDFMQIKKIRRNYRIALWGFSLAMAVALGFTAVYRWEVAGYVLAVLLAAGWVFARGMWGLPIKSYFTFVQDMIQGRDRILTGEIAAIEKDASEQQSIHFDKIHLREEGSSPDDPSRIFYYDNNKLPVPCQVGDKVELTSFGHFVKELHRIDSHST